MSDNLRDYEFSFSLKVRKLDFLSLDFHSHPPVHQTTPGKFLQIFFHKTNDLLPDENMYAIRL